MQTAKIKLFQLAVTANGYEPDGAPYGTEAEIAKLEKALAEARALLSSDQRDLLTALERGKALKAEVDALVDPDLEEIPGRIRAVEVTNEHVRQKKARAVLVDELAAKEAEAKRLDAEVAAVDEQKAAALAAASLPVQGLAFDEAGASFDGLPLEQASQAQQLRISVAIGSALNPRLRAMLVRDGSLLDSDSLALLKEEATRADLQVWLEVVGRDGEGIVIEDGAVVGTEPQQAVNT